MAKSYSDLPTIIDVAETAQVSVATVSRVLNHSPQVGAAKRERVHTAIKALDYRPQRSARILAGGSSGLVLLLHGGSIDPFLARFQDEAVRACSEAGRHLVVDRLDVDSANWLDYLERLIASIRPDGVVLTGAMSSEPAVRGTLRLRGIPYVRLMPGGDPHESGGITTDEVAAGEALARQLLEQGHTRIGYLTHSGRFVDPCQRGVGRALYAEDLSLEAQHVLYASAVQVVQEIKTLLTGQHPPTALVVASLGLAVQAHAIAALADLPIALACFDPDGLSRGQELPFPVLRRPIAKLASESIAALLNSGTSASDDRARTRRIETPAIVPGLAVSA